MAADIQKILVLRFGSLGDVVLATATFRRLRALYPQAKIYAAVKQEFSPLLLSHPCVDEVLPFDSRHQHHGLAGFFHYGRLVRGLHFNLVVDLHGNLRSRAFSAISGARVLRAGKEWLPRRMLVWFKHRPSAGLPHVAQRYLNALAPLGGAGLDPLGARPDLHVSAADSAWAENYLLRRGVRRGDLLIGVSPGAAWPTKRWPARHFAAALDQLALKLPRRSRLLFMGGTADLFACEEVVARMRRAAPLALVSAGDTSVGQLMALMARCHALLTNDSGPMHVAVGLGVPVAALFGPTVLDFGFAPLGPRDRVFERELPCRPCTLHGAERCPLVNHACMEGIEPGPVAAALAGLMRPKGRRKL
jgi:heptosyltransferase-2